MKKKIACALFINMVAWCIFNVGGFGQEPKHAASEEVKAEVPALSEFHEVIYKIWHNAWPEKNVGMMQGLIPEIQERAKVLVKAKLPGILRDKQKEWKQNIDKLQDIVAEYKKAAAPLDSQKLLDAAEHLHAQYEKLVRTIRPPLKEIDAFHVVLYQLYHHEMPAGEFDKMKSSIATLKEKMNALNNVILPERMKAKEEKFIAALRAIAASLTDLEKVVSSNDKKVIQEKIESLHSKYQQLEKVFD